MTASQKPKKQKRKKKPKFSDSEVIAALKAAGGMYSAAARKLSEIDERECSRSLVERRVRVNPKVKKICTEISEAKLDFAESQLFELIREGDFKAIQFFLSAKGTSRGYAPERAGNLFISNEVKIGNAVDQAANFAAAITSAHASDQVIDQIDPPIEADPDLSDLADDQDEAD